MFYHLQSSSTAAYARFIFPFRFLFALFFRDDMIYRFVWVLFQNAPDLRFIIVEEM